MVLPLKIERPLAIFDIEATGTSTRADRIIELGVIKIMPGGDREIFCWKINPGMPIPPESSEIHGITDADVVDAPEFKDVAKEIFETLNNCDLGGYNNTRFDIPMLMEEFSRVNIFFDIEDRRIIDIQRIFHRREPRDLTAALSFYCGEQHIDAHGALPDVEATIKVLEGQYLKYHDLPVSVDELDEYCNPRDPTWADRIGRLKWVDGKMTINFGKKKGTPVSDILKEDPGFIQWMLRNDFPADTKKLLNDATHGTFPEPPAKRNT